MSAPKHQTKRQLLVNKLRLGYSQGGRKRLALVLVLLAFGVLGTIAVVRSHAATATVAMEAEDGQKSGNQGAGPTAGASQNASVLFGAGGGGNPGGGGGGGGNGQIYMGAAVEPDQLDDPQFVAALKKYKFDSLTPENAMKQQNIHPAAGQWDWTGADKIVNFAQANGMRVRGHTLIWYRDPPSWLNDVAAGAPAQQAMKDHIETIVSRYKGKVAEWDVVNEALNDDGTLRTDNLWRTKVGDNFMELAFQYAHEADPSAQLFYNEYSAESRDLDGNGTTGRAAKSDAVYAMVKDFKTRGIPIDGVGLQTHSSGQYPGGRQALADNMKRLAALGVKTEITELDAVNIGDANAQATRYGDVGGACKDAAGGCTGVTTWGLYDGHTWLGTDKAPLMLDVNYNAKPAYFALTSAIGHAAGQ